MSTIVPGVARRNFIIGIKLCPPASSFASSPRSREQAQRVGDVARPDVVEGDRNHAPRTAAAATVTALTMFS